MNVMKDAKHLIPPAITLALLLSVLVPFVHGAPKDGVHTLEFNAQGGRVRVFLPDDLSAGDRVSSSFRIYPDGTTAEAKEKNSALLSGLIIETSYFNAPVSDGSITFEVPKNAGGSTLVFALVGKDGRRLGSSRVPVRFPEQGTRRPEKPTPFDYQCPVVGQAGRLIEIKGPFDGDFATTDFKVGGVKPFVLSESPRKLVFESPAEVSGTVDLILNEQEVVVNRPYTCLQVVKIDEKGVTPVRSSHTDSTFVTETAVREEALPPVKQSLSFDSIKTEETLSGPPPEGAPELAVTENSGPGNVNDAPSSAAGTPDGRKAVIIARQMDARMHSRPILSRRSPGEREAKPAASAPVETETAEVIAAAPGGDLVEKPLEEIEPDISPAKPESDTGSGSASSDAPGSPLTGDIALKAGIVDGQMLALYSPAAGKRGVNPIKASPAKKTSAKKGFSVQVASLRFSDDADLLAAELRKKGYDSYVVPVDVPGKGKLYRVRIGAFKARKEASSYAAGLKKKDPVFKSVFVAEND
jgi:cell division protein FtsN